MAKGKGIGGGAIGLLSSNWVAVVKGGGCRMLGWHVFCLPWRQAAFIVLLRLEDEECSSLLGAGKEGRLLWLDNSTADSRDIQ